MASESKIQDEMMVLYRLIRADTKTSFLRKGSESKRPDEMMVLYRLNERTQSHLF